MNRKIPGFYYDPQKGKYFRIEPTATAPSTAAWAAGNVRKRAAAEEEEARTRRARVRKEKGGVGRVKRAVAALGVTARVVGDGR
ncbi:hypothetical protein C8A05DRAFT_38079, partial [Staphylotrichum tortipilum]